VRSTIAREGPPAPQAIVEDAAVRVDKKIVNDLGSFRLRLPIQLADILAKYLASYLGRDRTVKSGVLRAVEIEANASVRPILFSHDKNPSIQPVGWLCPDR